MAKIDALLKLMIEHQASDLHVTSGSPPLLRIDGELERIAYHELTEEEVRLLIYEIVEEGGIKQLESGFDVDFAYEVERVARYRLNAYFKNGGLGAVFRMIPYEIKTFSELGLPPAVRTLARLRKGLVIVTGPTGCGKTTTLAAIIDLLNKERKAHIITLEDPLEFIHENQTCLIMQRQVGVHVESFASGLRAALREDPNIIMVGEMRDLETIEIALTAAETGHLVLSTLHTVDAVESINRIVSVFPPYQQPQVRHQLASILRGVISQRLIERCDRKGRVPAVEILVSTAMVRECIADPDKTMDIKEAIAKGHTIYGMQSFDQSVLSLYRKGLITFDEALKQSSNPDDFLLKVKGVSSSSDTTWEAFDQTQDELKEEEYSPTRDPEIERFAK
jgi:twitching motility protein PilT